MAAARSRLAIALAALGIAFAACFGGDHGAARAAVGNATGPLIGSSRAGAAILAANGMKPGDVLTGTIEVTNIGDTAGTFALAAIGMTPTPLARELDLEVRDVGRTPAVVYSGKLDALSSVPLGDMAQDEAHTYRFSVSLPADAGDSFQGASSEVTFLWSATAPEPSVTPAPAPATTPARATTAQAPPKATTAGGTVKSGCDRHCTRAAEGQDRQGHRHRRLCRQLPGRRERNRRRRGPRRSSSSRSRASCARASG